jgi:hypothetical protein
MLTLRLRSTLPGTTTITLARGGRTLAHRRVLVSMHAATVALRLPRAARHGGRYRLTLRTVAGAETHVDRRTVKFTTRGRA